MGKIERDDEELKMEIQREKEVRKRFNGERNKKLNPKICKRN